MSSAPLMATRVNKESELVEQSNDDPRSDWFRQFLTFDTPDLEAANYSNVLELALLAKPSSRSKPAGTSNIHMWWGEAKQCCALSSQGEPAELDAALHRDNKKGIPVLLNRPCKTVNPGLDLFSLKQMSIP